MHAPGFGLPLCFPFSPRTLGHPPPLQPQLTPQSQSWGSRVRPACTQAQVGLAVALSGRRRKETHPGGLHVHSLAAHAQAVRADCQPEEKISKICCISVACGRRRSAQEERGR